VFKRLRDDGPPTIVPSDLEAAFDDAPEAKAAYQALIDSAKKQYCGGFIAPKGRLPVPTRIEENHP
jgi:uncharacterized protein YdeI (YjbR/CyaY-like superfamily)